MMLIHPLEAQLRSVSLRSPLSEASGQPLLICLLQAQQLITSFPRRQRLRRKGAPSQSSKTSFPASRVPLFSSVPLSVVLSSAVVPLAALFPLWGALLVALCLGSVVRLL